MSTPARAVSTAYGRIRSALRQRSPRRQPPERLLVVMAALVQPLFQVQLPAYAAAPVAAVAALAALRR
jgi:hypothetical protein